MNLVNRWVKLILLVLIGLGITCCLGFIVYRTAVWRENKICYMSLADEFSVSPTYLTIGNAILDHIKSRAGPNPNRLEILSAMTSIAPIIEYEKITLSTGEIKQRIFLNTCKFTENGFDFIVVFSKEEMIMDLLLYLDD